jgi:hypothetical protein
LERLWTPYVADGDESSYGYGWSIAVLPGGEKIIAHNGGNGIFFANLMIVPAERLVIYMETNIAADMFLVEGIMESIGRRILLGDSLPYVPPKAELSGRQLTAIAGTYRLDDSNSFDVRTQEGKILIVPHGRKSLGLLHSKRPIDYDRCERLSSRMDTIVAALLVGDFDPIFEAYNRKVPLERIQNSWRERRGEWEQVNGALERHEVLGAVHQESRDLVLVRFYFDRGTADRAYVWSMEETPTLLGSSVRGLDPVLHCIGVEGGGFSSWDPNSGDNRPFQIEDIGDRHHMRFGPEVNAFEAVR